MGKKKKKQKKEIYIIDETLVINSIYNDEITNSEEDTNDQEVINNTEDKMNIKQNKLSDAIFVVIALFAPFLCKRLYKIKDDMHVQALVLLISGVLIFIGMVSWVLGIFSIFYFFLKADALYERWMTVLITLGLLFLASMLIFSGEAFSKENDSSKIYSFTSCVVAIVSCVISAIALIKQFKM